jgi:hypothetical protein
MAIESTGSPELDAINARLEQASSPKEEMAVLEEFMSHDQAINSIGLHRGDRSGDVVDVES